MGRLLGMDYGQRRIGLALSDPTGTIASAHSVVEYDHEREALEQIAEVCRTHDVEAVVLGLPINMDGSEGGSAAAVRSFSVKLEKRVELPVRFWDERLSTRSAEAVLIEAGTSRQKRKGLVDKVSAQIMLQNYLDAKSPPTEE